MRSNVPPLMRLFERTGLLYAGGIMEPAWEGAGNQPGSQMAIEIFLGQYAYERAGASPSYAPAACQAIRLNSGNLDPRSVWATFTERVSGPANPLRNPLFHEETRACRCLLCACGGRRARNLITTTRDDLANGDVTDAYKTIKAIRGVGPKIASFFLRDVAMTYQLAPTQNRYLLQPVDLWISRISRALDDRLQDNTRAIGEWMVRNSEEPELANAGMWYFGSRIARKPTYLKALADPGFALSLAECHVTGLRRAAKAWDGGG